MIINEVKENGTVTLWDCETGIGLRFREGETLQRYTAAIVVSPLGIESFKDLYKLQGLAYGLQTEAAERYPKEFDCLK